MGVILANGIPYGKNNAFRRALWQLGRKTYQGKECATHPLCFTRRTDNDTCICCAQEANRRCVEKKKNA